jgi:hypothetical protein
MKQRITPYLKSTTVVSVSEYKKLSPFEKRIIKFCQKREERLFLLIPISFFLMIWLCAYLNNFWYLLVYFIVYGFTFLALIEKYGKVSNTTYHCSCCNSELKYQGKDYYSDWYSCPKCKEDIEC